MWGFVTPIKLYTPSYLIGSTTVRFIHVEL